MKDGKKLKTLLLWSKSSAVAFAASDSEAVVTTPITEEATVSQFSQLSSRCYRNIRCSHTADENMYDTCLSSQQYT